MPVIPSRVLPIDITVVLSTATWDIDDGTSDPFIGNPFQWSVTYKVSTVSHSSHVTPTPFFYNGLDIKVGDWISSQVNGLSTKILSITTATPSLVTCIVEDVDRFNTFSDPFGNGIGAPAVGKGFVFALGDDGLPILSGVPSGILSPSFQEDTVSRFRFRNLRKNFFRVNMPSHTFAVGDVLRIDSTGTYLKAIANSSVTSIVGEVNSINTPGPDWFTYKPIGEILQTIIPTLPGVPGDLIYVDPSTPGALTATKPSTFAKPIFLKLNSAGNQGILLNRNAKDVPSGGGGSSSTQIVADIPSRDALMLNTGDQVFVIDASGIPADAGPGEFAHYLWDGAQFVKLTSSDSSATDSRSLSITLTNASSSVTILGRLSDGSRITVVTADVLTPFNNSSATLSVGDDSNSPTTNTRFMDISENDLLEVGVYEILPSFIYNTSGAETDIKVYLNSAGSTSGQVKVTISYS